MAVGEVWNADELMGGPAPAQDPHAKKSKKPVKGRGVDKNPLLWGQPGHLTKEECDTYFRFKEELEKRGGDFRDTIYCFGEEEGEVWTLCRWLRARKFVYDDVITMVEEATKTRATAKANNYYPDSKTSLGVHESLYYAMYPQLYTGHAKNGVPLFISKPGILNVDGMECITTLDGIVNFHWYIMMHDFANRLRAQKVKDPEFKQFACLSVLDLDKLTTSQLTRKCLDIIKEQSAISSICFPETMYKMVIINSPTFFSMTWRLIKGWLDPRTANKIEVISNKKKGEERLRELVDVDQLPVDYGGEAEDTNKTIAKKADGRIDFKIIHLKAKGEDTIQIDAGEKVEIEVFTRSTVGAKFTVLDANVNNVVSPEMLVKHTGTDHEKEFPTGLKITPDPISGPKNIKVKAESTSGSKKQTYMYVFMFKK